MSDELTTALAELELATQKVRCLLPEGEPEPFSGKVERLRTCGRWPEGLCTGEAALWAENTTNERVVLRMLTPMDVKLERVPWRLIELRLRDGAVVCRRLGGIGSDPAIATNTSGEILEEGFTP